MSDDYSDWLADHADAFEPWTPEDEPNIDWDLYELGEWAGEWAASNAEYLDYLDRAAS